MSARLTCIAALALRLGLAALALRLGLAALFLYAGVAKLVDPAAFVEEIANYRLLPALAPLFGATLPMLEVTIGLVLVFGPGTWRAAAALVSLAVLVVFTIAVASAWLRGVDVRCGCFGTGGGPVDGYTVLRDLAFVLWSALTLVDTLRHVPPSSQEPGSSS